MKSALRLLLSVGIAVLLVALLLYWGDLSLAEIGDTLGKLDGEALLDRLFRHLLDLKATHASHGSVEVVRDHDIGVVALIPWDLG